MHSSATCAGQAHSPAATGEQCAVQLCVRMYVTTSLLKSASSRAAGSGALSNKDFLDPHESALPKRHLDRFSRFCTTHPCIQHTRADRHTDTKIRATFVAIGRIYNLIYNAHSVKDMSKRGQSPGGQRRNTSVRSQLIKDVKFTIQYDTVD